MNKRIRKKQRTMAHRRHLKRLWKQARAERHPLRRKALLFLARTTERCGPNRFVVIDELPMLSMRTTLAPVVPSWTPSRDRVVVIEQTRADLLRAYQQPLTPTYARRLRRSRRRR